MANRLEVLQNSLVKKQEEFNARLNVHFEDVKAAQGEPLKGHARGNQILSRWEKQNNALRELEKGIEKTKQAIEKEKNKIANVAGYEVPECLKKALEEGIITQWRKFPRFFFVVGVEKARILVMDNGIIGRKYCNEIPNEEQYAKFKEVFNSIKKLEEELKS